MNEKRLRIPMTELDELRLDQWEDYVKTKLREAGFDLNKYIVSRLPGKYSNNEEEDVYEFIQ